jgi:cell division protein FtsL
MATALKSRQRGIGTAKQKQIRRDLQPLGRRQIGVMSFLLLALVGLVLTHVWLRLQVVHMGYVLSTTSKLHSQLEQEHGELKLELATVTSAERLEATARQRLGLVYPEKGQVVILP